MTTDPQPTRRSRLWCCLRGHPVELHISYASGGGWLVCRCRRLDWQISSSITEVGHGGQVYRFPHPAPLPVTDPQPPLFLLTLTGVYDQGCAGIFTDKDAAEAHAAALYAQSDHYHNFRIDEIHVDQPITDARTLGDPAQFKSWKPADPEIDFASWPEQPGNESDRS